MSGRPDVPTLILRTDGELTDEQAELLKARFREAVKGPVRLMYDFPLRPDLFVTLNLPIDLTKDDAERLCGFIMTLPFPLEDGAS